MSVETVPSCDMTTDCGNTVAWVGRKGYVYCDAHRSRRVGWEATRRLRKWELRWLAEGRALPSYEPMPEPEVAR